MGNANGVSPSIHLCRAIEFYKASENTDVWYLAFHWPSAGVQFQQLQLSPSGLWTVDITDWQSACRLEGSFAFGSFIIPAFTKSGLMTVIDGYTCAPLQLTNRHQCS